MSQININAPKSFSASNNNSLRTSNKLPLSHEISDLHELHKQHTEENEQFSREHDSFEQKCIETQSQTEEDLSHVAALLIQVGEVEQATNAVLAQIKADKMVVAQLRQEMQVITED